MKNRKHVDRPSTKESDRSNASWLKSIGGKRNLRRTSRQHSSSSHKIPSESSGGRRRKRSNKEIWTDDNKQDSAKAPAWLLAILTLFLAGFFGILIFAFVNKSKNTNSSTPTSHQQKTTDEEILEKDLGPITSLLPHEVAKAFTTTADPQERLKYCRHPKRVEALIPEFPPQTVSDVGVSGAPMGELNIGELEMHRFQVGLEGGDSRVIYVVRTEHGHKVDWEAFARHSQTLKRWIEEAQKNTLPEREEETAKARVFATRDSYFNFRFSDDRDWRAYKIGSSDLGSVVTAYVKAGSTTAKILEQEIATEKRVTLLLRSTAEDARNGQYEIVKILAIDWVEPNEDFEASWLKTKNRLAK